MGKSKDKKPTKIKELLIMTKCGRLSIIGDADKMSHLALALRHPKRPDDLILISSDEHDKSDDEKPASDKDEIYVRPRAIEAMILKKPDNKTQNIAVPGIKFLTPGRN